MACLTKANEKCGHPCLYSISNNVTPMGFHPKKPLLRLICWLETTFARLWEGRGGDARWAGEGCFLRRHAHGSTSIAGSVGAPCLSAGRTWCGHSTLFEMLGGAT